MTIMGENTRGKEARKRESAVRPRSRKAEVAAAGRNFIGNLRERFRRRFTERSEKRADGGCLGFRRRRRTRQAAKRRGDLQA